MADALKPTRPQYGTVIREYDLGEFGKVQWHRWLHPTEADKPMNAGQIKYLRKFLREGDAAVDIGAHSGDTAIPFAVAVGKTGRVLAFEPNPMVFEILKKNAVINPHNCSPIDCVEAAVMEKAGTYQFGYTDIGLCNGGFGAGPSPGMLRGHTSPVEVQGVELGPYLDDLASRHKIGYVKIDTEGYDRQVVRANHKQLLALGCTLNVELYPTLSNEDRQEFAALLEPYNLFREWTDIPAPHSMIVENHNLYDLICVPKK